MPRPTVQTAPAGAVLRIRPDPAQWTFSSSSSSTAWCWAAIYALVALGYTMVYGILGLINFAHGEVVMIGALVALAVIQRAARQRRAGCPGR